MDTPRTYTATELKEILQMQLTEIYRAGAAGEIPGRFRIGRRTRWHAETVDAWLAGQVERVER